MKIAITGEMRSGKDTAARYFIDNDDAIQLAFGDGIKRVSRTYFPQIVELGKPRKLYQFIGQRFREMDADVWIKDLAGSYINLLELGLTNFVVSDLRQSNEYEYLKRMGFTVIKIEADEELRKERIIASGDIFDPEDFYHETELAVKNIPADYVVSNNTNLFDLHDQLYFIHNELKGDNTT